jgi:mono/diheme cytochrome c family protein
VTLALRARGADVAAPSAIELRRLGGERVTVDDPHEHRAIELEGVRATTLFDATLGPSWRNAEEIVATCVDGFHPAIPVSLFLEHDAYVAYARPDSADFAIQESPTKRTAVGPYYVVWKKEAGLAPPEPAWPFEVTALEATDFATRFAAAIPPRDAGALAQEGFERFRTFCLPCHTINGAGGAVGPELNYPVSVTEYFAGPVLRQWITDPNRVRWNAKMPPPLPADAEQPRAIEAIVGYLEAMAGAKREPRRQ